MKKVPVEYQIKTPVEDLASVDDEVTFVVEIPGNIFVMDVVDIDFGVDIPNVDDVTVTSNLNADTDVKATLEVTNCITLCIFNMLHQSDFTSNFNEA